MYVLGRVPFFERVYLPLIVSIRLPSALWVKNLTLGARSNHDDRNVLLSFCLTQKSLNDPPLPSISIHTHKTLLQGD